MLFFLFPQPAIWRYGLDFSLFLPLTFNVWPAFSFFPCHLFFAQSPNFDFEGIARDSFPSKYSFCLLPLSFFPPSRRNTPFPFCRVVSAAERIHRIPRTTPKTVSSEPSSLQADRLARLFLLCAKTLLLSSFTRQRVTHDGRLCF